jgi:pyruvate,water dikinase
MPFFYALKKILCSESGILPEEVPDKIEEYKHLPFDGIGLMRLEFILASYIGQHPMYLLETGQVGKFVNQLAEGIATAARAIQPRLLVVRLGDFKTNKYRVRGRSKIRNQRRKPDAGLARCQSLHQPMVPKSLPYRMQSHSKIQ